MTKVPCLSNTQAKYQHLPSASLLFLCNSLISINQIAGGHPTLNRLSDNSISEQKHVKNMVYKTFKGSVRICCKFKVNFACPEYNSILSILNFKILTSWKLWFYKKIVTLPLISMQRTWRAFVNAIECVSGVWFWR